MGTPEFVIVGRVRRAHGIRGEVVVEPITDEPDAVFASGRRFLVGDAHGELVAGAPELRIGSVRPFKEGLLIAFDGVGDRTAAERWRDRFLFVSGNELTAPGEGEAYVHELAGMRVVLESGEEVGEVRDVFELPQGYAIEVARGAGTTVIPLLDEFLVSVERDARRIIVNLPDGLLE